MTSKLQSVIDRFDKLNEFLSDPAVVSDISLYTKYTKELSDITETAEKIKELIKVEKEKEDAEASISLEKDPDMKELLYQEIKELNKQLEVINEELKILLIPKDKNDDKSVIVEIRAGAGGEEAALQKGK